MKSQFIRILFILFMGCAIMADEIIILMADHQYSLVFEQECENEDGQEKEEKIESTEIFYTIEKYTELISTIYTKNLLKILSNKFFKYSAFLEIELRPPKYC